MPEFGLECKAPWCQRILDGDKTIEVRRYEPPPDLIGRRIWLLATTGAENVPSLGDDVPAGSDVAEMVGSVVFSGVKEYLSMESWSADARRHLVPQDSPYAFREGEGKAFGWIVQDRMRLPQPMPVPKMKRLMRSIYEMLT